MSDKFGNEWKVFVFLGGLCEVGHGHARGLTYSYHYTTDYGPISLVAVLTFV